MSSSISGRDLCPTLIFELRPDGVKLEFGAEDCRGFLRELALALPDAPSVVASLLPCSAQSVLLAASLYSRAHCLLPLGEPPGAGKLVGLSLAELSALSSAGKHGSDDQCLQLVEGSGCGVVAWAGDQVLPAWAADLTAGWRRSKIQLGADTTVILHLAVRAYAFLLTCSRKGAATWRHDLDTGVTLLHRWMQPDLPGTPYLALPGS